MKTPTIYDIKYDTMEKSPYFFTRKTMRFFKQTMRSFHVNKTDNAGIFYLWARMPYGITSRYYVPKAHDLFHEFDSAVEALEEIEKAETAETAETAGATE